MRTTTDPIAPSPAVGKDSVSKADVIFFALVLTYTYTQLFLLPLTPIYFDGDTLVPVSNAIRILDGEVIYKDFFHFITPGADIWYAAVFGAFGRKIWVVNATILMLTMAQVALLWRLSRSVLSGWAVYLPALIFLALGFRQFSVDGSYRLFSLVFALSAIAVLIDRRTLSRVVMAGFLCGLASAFQQPRGVLALAAILLFLVGEALLQRRGWAESARFAGACVAAFAVTLVLTQAYFIFQAGWDNYYASTIGFIRDHYRADPFNNNTAYLSDLIALIEHFVSTGSLWSGNTRLIVISSLYYAVIPYIYLVLLAFLVIRRKSISKERSLPGVILIAVAGICLAAGVSAPTIIRVFQVAAPGLIVLVWLLSRSELMRRAAAPAAAGLVLILFAAGITRQSQTSYYLDMPAGGAAFLFEPTYQKYRWMAENTRPGDVVYEPHHPNYYFPFELRNPTPLYMARDSDYTPSAQVADVVKALEAQAPVMIIWPVAWKKAAAERSPDDHMGPIWELLQRYYGPVHTFPNPPDPMTAVYSDSEVWSRVDGK